MESVRLVSCCGCHSVRIMRTIEQPIGTYNGINLYLCNVCTTNQAHREVVVDTLMTPARFASVQVGDPI